MIAAVEIIILNTENGKREILPTPLMLHSKNLREEIKSLAEKMKGGKIVKLFLYEHWVDDQYKATLEREYSYLPDDFKTEKFLINYGQDFGKYYLGYLYADFDNKSCSIPEDQADKADDLKLIGDLFFSEDRESRTITIFTPTRPDDIKIAQM